MCMLSQPQTRFCRHPCLPRQHSPASGFPLALHALPSVPGCRGACCRRAFLIGDLPFGSYEASAEQAVHSGIRLLKEGGMHALKLEGVACPLLGTA